MRKTSGKIKANFNFAYYWHFTVNWCILLSTARNVTRVDDNENGRGYLFGLGIQIYE